MFRIKICGITGADDAHAAAAAGADAIGLNFYERSPRYLPLEAADRVVAAVPDSIIRVGVFVNAPLAALLAARLRFRLDYLQLHGDESPQMVADLPAGVVIRGLRVPADDPYTSLEAYVAECSRCGGDVAGLLLDARQSGQYGGTGQSLNWPLLRERPASLGTTPLILAGGLRPENVASAIDQARPDAVDAASGVETAPGVKDPRRMQQFIALARAAFDAMNPVKNG
jgi:phosphoribosylanthranilate isomerase